MANQIQRLSFEYGTVQSVNTSTMQCVLMTPLGRKDVRIPSGASVVVIPAVGECWKFYRDGRESVLYDRVSSSDSESSGVFQGDMLVNQHGTLRVSAQVVDVVDEHGETFNPITGTMNPNRSESTRVYAVSSEGDGKSIDGRDVVAPCLLAVVSQDGVNMIWRAE